MSNTVPRLRFKEFKEQWSRFLYSNVYTFYSTNSLSREKLNYERGEIKNIHYGDIHTKFQTQFDITKEKVPFINPDVDTSKIKEDSFCQEGDLVVADASEDYNDIGKAIELVNLLNEKIVAGLHTFLARPDKTKVSKGFGAYLIQSPFFRKQVKTIAQGTKILSLSSGRLAKLILPIPTLSEQKEITSFLSAIDEKIRQLKRRRVLLEEYKKGLMQQIFSGKLRFKEENGTTYPQWEKKKLGDISMVVRGASPRPKGDKRYYGGAIPRLMVQDVTRDGKYVTPRTDFLTEEGSKLSRPCKAGTLTIVCSGTVGIPSFLAVDACLHDGFLALTDVDLNYSSDYIYHNLTTLRDKLESNATHGGVFTNLTTKALKEFEIVFPCLREQRKIENYLSAIDAIIEGVNNQESQTQNFKKGLLHQMFIEL